MTNVLHSLPYWLPATSTWLDTLIKNLPDRIGTSIVCEYTQNLNRFPVSNLYSLRDLSLSRYIWDKGLSFVGIRNHMGFVETTILAEQPDVIHSHWGNYGWKNAELCKRLAIPHIVTFYGKDVNYLPQSIKWKKRYEQLFSKIDLVICEGPHMGQCLEKLGCPPSRIQVVHLGIDLKRYPYQPRTWDHSQPLKFLIAGSFREKKGIPYALAGIGSWIKRGGNAHITIIGDSDRDPRSQTEKAKIMATIEKFNMARQVTHLGYCTHQQLIDHAYLHHIFISPSVTAEDGDTEGGAPVTIIEMAATGMPIISTTHCDIPNVVPANRCALLVEERDSTGIASAIETLTETHQNWHCLTDNARSRIEKEFNVTTQAAKVAAIYDELAGRP